MQAGAAPTLMKLPRQPLSPNLLSTHPTMHMHCCRTCRLIKLDTVGSNASFQHLSRPNGEWVLAVTIGCLPGGNRLATPNAVRVSRFLWESCHGAMDDGLVLLFSSFFLPFLLLSLSPSHSKPSTAPPRHRVITLYCILYIRYR